MLIFALKFQHVEGEVYEVDEKMMSNLDILEDHPKLYERKVNVIKSAIFCAYRV